jgi:hypothetical protein
MPRRLRSNRGISAERAHQALAVLVHEGKLKAAEVWRALERRERILNELKGRLEALGGDLKGMVAKNAPSRMGRRRAEKPQRKASKARRAAMAMHGKYLGAIRQLSKANRAKAKAIREKSGVRAAIAAAKRMAR